jgi:hypothetical protein
MGFFYPNTLLKCLKLKAYVTFISFTHQARINSTLAIPVNLRTVSFATNQAAQRALKQVNLGFLYTWKVLKLQSKPTKEKFRLKRRKSKNYLLELISGHKANPFPIPG